MTVSVKVDNRPITATVSGDAVAVTVTGGVGPQGPAGVGEWNTITGKPLVFPPDQHAASHAAAGSDPITVSASQISGGALPANASLDFSDGTSDSEIGGWGFGVELTEDGSVYATVEPSAVTVHGASGYAALQSQAVYFSNGTSLAVGTFDSGRAGYNGISMVCAVGYELNWQAGYLKCLNVNGTTRTIACESPIEFPGEGTANVTIDATGVTFSDGSQQTAAWDGNVPSHAASHLANGSDPLFDQALNTTDSPAFYQLSIGNENAGFVDLGWQGGEFQISGFGRHIGIETGYIGGDWYFSAGASFNFTDCSISGISYDDLDDLPSPYSLPTASSTVLGGVKIGSGISIDGSGVISASAGYTLPNATTTTLGGVIIGTGLSVASGTASVSYGTSSGTACQGNDSRLTDSREWSASTVSQADAEAGTSTTRAAFTPLRVFQAIAAWWAGSAAKTKLDGIATGATANATDAQLRDRSTHTGTQAWSTITSTPTSLSGYGITDGVTTSDSRLTDARTPTSHAHGNITNAGAIGSTSGLIVVTTTSGVLTTASSVTEAQLPVTTTLHPFLLAGM